MPAIIGGFMKKKQLLVLLSVIFLFVFISCSKKASPTSPVAEPTTPPVSATVTETDLGTLTATPTVTITAPDATVTVTSTLPENTRTATATLTASPTLTATDIILSSTASATATATLTATDIIPSSTPSATATATLPENTYTSTVTQTATGTLTGTMTNTMTLTDTIEETPTLTATITITPTATVTVTLTATPLPVWADFGTNPVSSDMGGMPVLRNYSSQFYLLYIDGAQGGKLSAKYHNGFAWGSAGDGISSDVASYPSMELSSGDMYCAYAQLGKVYFKRKLALTWQAEYQISDGNANYPDIFVYSGTSQYISYRDEYGAAAGKASLKTGQGSAWSLVGLSGFNTVAVKDTDVVVASGAVPYVACQEETGNVLGKVEVMTYNGASWSQVGTTITARTGCNIDMVYGGGYLYLAYAAPQSPYPVQVIRSSGGAWTPVGGIVNNVEAADISLSYDVYQGTINVAFTDVSSSNSGKAFAWNGVSWNQIGGIFNDNISTSSAIFPSLNVYNGVPYVAFKDTGTLHNGKIVTRVYR